MKSKKSEFLKAFGKMWEIVKLLVNAVLDMGGGDEDLERLLKDPARIKKIAEFIVEKAASAFTVTVDYTQSLADMIVAGRYDWKDHDITAKHFPVSESGQVTIGLELVHFGKDMSTTAALAELDRRGLRPATLPELLAFGVKYPDEQRKYPIVALGSVWSSRNGSRCVASLLGRAGERELNLSFCDDGWNGHCRFLAASK